MGKGVSLLFLSHSGLAQAPVAWYLHPQQNVPVTVSGPEHEDEFVHVQDHPPARRPAGGGTRSQDRGAGGDEDGAGGTPV